MSSSVTVLHTFEAGHRLPHLPGKCQSLHGHSWTVAVTVTAPAVDPKTATVAHFGDLKRHLRAFVDDNLDHGLMLGGADPLVAKLAPEGKVFVFDSEVIPSTPERAAFTKGLYWPSVENVAALLAYVMRVALTETEHAEGAYVSKVTVSETSVNSATWEPELGIRIHPTLPFTSGAAS